MPEQEQEPIYEYTVLTQGKVVATGMNYPVAMILMESLFKQFKGDFDLTLLRRVINVNPEPEVAIKSEIPETEEGKTDE